MVMPTNYPEKWDYWTSSPSDDVELICLLPNSVYIDLKTTCDATLQKVKQDIWDRAIHYPLFRMLREMSEYVFQFVNSLAVLEEVYDETKRLCDIGPILGVLLIKESAERPGEQLLNMQISHLIGKGLNEFDSLRSPEVKDFRQRMGRLAEDNMIKQSQSSQLDKLKYQYPPRLAGTKEIPSTLRKYLQSNFFELITVYADTTTVFPQFVPTMRTPMEHVDMALKMFADVLNIKTLQSANHNDYVLKVCGRREYLIGDVPFIQFLYIQEMLASNVKPRLMVVSIESLSTLMDSNIPFSRVPERHRLPSTEHATTVRRQKYESSWKIDRYYSCIVLTVARLNIDTDYKTTDFGKIGCEVGIYHGGRCLCETQKTREVVVSSDGFAEWYQELTFPIKVCNLPRMARLCFGIYTRTKGKRRSCENKVAWTNVQIYDYKEQLKTDAMMLSMWPHVMEEVQGDDILLHPLGTVAENPNSNCTGLYVRFSNYDNRVPIMFPDKEVVLDHAKCVDQIPSLLTDRLTTIFDKLTEFAKQEIHEQEKKDIWSARELFRVHAPELLPKLLSCVEWGDHSEVSIVASMLQNWPKFTDIELALELLDYSHADANVRSFAVKCLETITDEELKLYLLQLVQALKHEPYLMCDLAVFLLRRAFNNMTIGHYLFWHLRSEKHMLSSWIRFGLMLEAYCRGSQQHINSLMRQINCLEKLKWLSIKVSEMKDITKARACLSQHLQERHIETLCEFVSPLNPSYMCKKIKPQGCRVMDSKKRPLMLDFENVDPTGGDIRIILKLGDDLRQDMLTLQMLRVMDRVWKSEGCDYRLNPYNCISMEYMVGMIEVVEEAETVANIQKQSALVNATSSFNKSNLLQWLRKHTDNTTDALDKAVDEFTMSCAGYCVATYVLGIADRHPDNIMVKKNGQLFHIDFGHFLGHYKQKYGFKRENVPFVLTRDFIHVINKGKRFDENMNKFKEYSEKAYQILRKHGNLIMSLFSIMISTGLPELSSGKDLQYLRDALVLDLSEEKALEHFRQKWDESIKKSWTTSVHWVFHNIDKNN